MKKDKDNKIVDSSIKKEKIVKHPLLQKIFNWIFGSLAILICAFAITYQVVSTISRSNNYGVANFFGYQTMVIATDSMEPIYEVGTGIIVKKVPVNEIKVGDDISFYYQINGTGVIITHRVEEIKLNEVVNEEQTYTFICHGINKDSDQCSGDCTYQTQTVKGEYVLGKVIGSSKLLGGFYSFIMTPYGLVTLILIPGCYLIVSSIIDIVKATKKDKEETKKKRLEGNISALDELSEEDKERLKEDLLNEILEEELSAKEEKVKEKDKHE